MPNQSTDLLRKGIDNLYTGNDFSTRGLLLQCHFELKGGKNTPPKNTKNKNNPLICVVTSST